MARSTQARLTDILDAINQARRADELLQQAIAQQNVETEEIAYRAILHSLFITGEAVRALPDGITDLEPTIDWSRIIAMRNLIGHEYHRISPEIIHATLCNELVPLEAAVNRLRQSVES